MQDAAGIDPRDRAAAGADAGDVETVERDRWPATRRPVTRVGWPPTISEMSVLVPPMSNGIRLPSPSSRAAWTLPATPPAGPDSTAPAASRAGLGDRRDAAMRLDDQGRAAVAGLGEPALQPRQIARQRRADIGVDDGRRDPLELLDLRQHLRGQRDVDVRAARVRCASRSRARGAGRGRRADSRPRPPRPVRASAWRWRASSEAGSSGVSTRPSARSRSRTPSRSCARDQLLGRRQAQIVAVVLQPLAHLDDVAMAFGRQQPDPRALVLEQRVGRDRRAVHDALGLARAAPRGRSRASRARARARRARRARVVGVEGTLARVALPDIVDRDKIGKRAADIDADRGTSGQPLHQPLPRKRGRVEGAAQASVRSRDSSALRTRGRGPSLLPPAGRVSIGRRQSHFDVARDRGGIALGGIAPAAAAAGFEHQHVAGADHQAGFLGPDRARPRPSE